MAINPNQFPPIGWVSGLEPFAAPQYIPPSPHNLPSRPDPAVASSSSPSSSAQFNPSDSVNVRETYRYSSLISLALTVGTTSFKFLDQPIGKRNMLGFRNSSSGSQNIYIDFGAAASTNSWLKLSSGAIILFDAVVPQDDLFVVADAAGATLSYVYSTFTG
jgi:hypothetical protein